jgi:MoxR-like ATPase
VEVASILNPSELVSLQRAAREVYVDPSLKQYAVKLVAATRDPAKYGAKEVGPWIQFGASPRATISLVEGARALAFLRGRRHALPEDFTELVPDVLRHRLTPTYTALSEGKTPEMVIARLMQAVPPPPKPLEPQAKAA